MARKSRKNLPEKEIVVKPVVLTQEQGQLPTGAYIRLSALNNGYKDADSISMQIKLVESFIMSHEELKLVETYVDNGYTGTEFDRPEFVRMMEDVKSGKIRCVVVKDLSRFGRDYLETGYYIETIFPLLNVRFIAITDQFDSARTEDRNSIVVPMKNMVNAMYAKDYSRKQSSYQEMRRKQGTVLSSSAPLGYRYSEEDRRLIIDETVESYIRMTFAWYFAGVTNAEIARRMNFLGAPTYSAMKQRSRKGYLSTAWSADTVKGIVHNPTYAGFAVMGKSFKSLYQGIPYKSMPREDWLMFPGINEAYITEDEYAKIVEKTEKNREHKKQRTKSTEDVREKMVDCFRYKVYCADCGKRMVFQRGTHHQRDGNITFAYYRCVSRKNVCKGIHLPVQQNYLKIVVMDQIRNLIRTACQRKEILEQLRRDSGGHSPVRSLEKKAGYLKSRQMELEQRVVKAYEDYAEGLLDSEDYLCIKEKIVIEKQRINDQLEELQTQIRSMEDAARRYCEWAENLENYLECKSYSQELVDSLIKEIRIADANRIEIVFACEDVYNNPTIGTLFQEVEHGNHAE